MKRSISWIETVSYDKSSDELREAYDAVRSGARVDNLYSVYSLRPQTLVPSDALYRAVLHSEKNTLPMWFSELIATYTAALGQCDYAYTHHSRNFVHLLGDEVRARRILAALPSQSFEGLLTTAQASALAYTYKLSERPQDMTRSDVQSLQAEGWSDGEILEINQVVATFAYFVRVLNGLGVSIAGDVIGRYGEGDSGVDQTMGKDA